MQSDEAKLIARLRNGEQAAFEAVVQAHYQSVWRQHYLFCGDADLAADLTQETFLQAWRSIGNFRGQSALRTWLYTIATRVWQRKGKPLVCRSVVPLPKTLHTESPEPEEIAVGNIEQEAITIALRHLPDDMRVTLILFYRQELTHAEIAEALGIPVGTVKSRIYDGVRRLRRILTPGEEAL
ncbi:MAG: sigma-70 family RNA polymerase sigma factor [Armatimonadaceae bacterium]